MSDKLNTYKVTWMEHYEASAKIDAYDEADAAETAVKEPDAYEVISICRGREARFRAMAQLSVQQHIGGAARISWGQSYMWTSVTETEEFVKAMGEAIALARSWNEGNYTGA